MNDKPDAFGRDDKQCEADANEGQEIAFLMLQSLGNIRVPVAYNLLGTMVTEVFEGIAFEDPGSVLAEFDNWVKYTRSILEKTVKERLS